MTGLRILLAALVIALGTIAAAVPTTAYAQGREGTGLGPEAVRALRRELRVALDAADNARGEAAAARRREALANANLDEVGRLLGVAPDAPYETLVAAAASWVEQDVANREQLADLNEIVHQMESGEIRDRAEYYLGLAQSAFEDGRLADADAALADLEHLRRSGSTEAADLWVGSVLARVGLARQQRDYDRAEDLLAEAERHEERQSRRRLFTLRSERADTAYERGDLMGDNAALERAVRLFNESLTLVDRAEDPDDWAMTQNNLGNALAALGKRKGDSARLEEAVAAYRAALLVYTRERVPLQWAATQNNLGNALWALGEHESGTPLLEEAVAAYRAALLERTRERAPLDWAATQNNLGNALWALGERESGTALLEEAVAAYRAALLELTRERVPRQWAMTQNNLGTALWGLGERESGTARLEEAVAAFEAALLERTRERVPLEWAATQSNLGAALVTLGERESGTARLEAAVAAYRAALLELTRERVPLDWAATQSNLGTALHALGKRESGTARLEEAVSAYEAALLELTRERVPLDWAETRYNQALVFGWLYKRTGDISWLDQGVAAASDAVTVFQEVNSVYRLNFARQALDYLNAARASLPQPRSFVFRNRTLGKRSPT